MSASTAPDDERLLQQFVVSNDQAAFRALVDRHGPMVLATCRRVLRNDASAEDAFQATFLVLAQKARQVQAGAALAGWLHRVALRAAIEIKRMEARRREHEREGGGDVSGLEPSSSSGPSSLLPGEDREQAWREAQPVLDAEVARLPERYRLPIVLCYLEGLTLEAAAKQLGLTFATLKGRLQRARDRLRKRLTGHGIMLSAVNLMWALTERAGPAALGGAAGSGGGTAAGVGAGSAGGLTAALAAATAAGCAAAVSGAGTAAVAGAALAAKGVAAGGFTGGLFRGIAGTASSGAGASSGLVSAKAAAAAQGVASSLAAAAAVKVAVAVGVAVVVASAVTFVAVRQVGADGPGATVAQVPRSVPAPGGTGTGTGPAALPPAPAPSLPSTTQAGVAVPRGAAAPPVSAARPPAAPPPPSQPPSLPGRSAIVPPGPAFAAPAPIPVPAPAPAPAPVPAPRLAPAPAPAALRDRLAGTRWVLAVDRTGGHYKWPIEFRPDGTCGRGELIMTDYFRKHGVRPTPPADGRYVAAPGAAAADRVVVTIGNETYTLGTIAPPPPPDANPPKVYAGRTDAGRTCWLERAAGQ